jgi:hypothetical protein
MTTLTENDDTNNTEEELIPVEATPEATPEATLVAEAEDDEEDGEDDRLAESEEDSEADITSSNTNRERRRKRREMQRRAREMQQRELAELRQLVAAQQQRLAAIEGFAAFSTTRSLEEQIARTQRDIQQAETIMAKASEAGNGDDMVAALRIRDSAAAELQRLTAARQQMLQRQQMAQNPPPPQINPVVVNYARQWMQANPWYDPQGRDRDSALTKAIDNELAQEGYDPATREYWEELTARVADALGETSSTKPAQQSRKKAPPMGNSREHAPVSTKKEIYVTPERKQAMIEAGVWDDPVLRQRYLKAYQAYDNGTAR